jgi:hypothetical protein
VPASIAARSSRGAKDHADRPGGPPQGKRRQVRRQAERVVLAEGAAVRDVLVQAKGRNREHQREQDELRERMVEAPAPDREAVLRVDGRSRRRARRREPGTGRGQCPSQA